MTPRSKLAAYKGASKWIGVLAIALLLCIAAIACGDASSSESGDAAPDFSLPVANRSIDITLSDFRDDKNVVLVFYRGFF